MASLTFTVLGPVRAWRGATEIDLGPPKQRALLALFLLDPGHPLSPDEIVAVLWGDEPPDSALNQVQRHVSVLRRLFESDLKARGASRFLVRGSGGYRLDVAPEAVDLGRFRALRRQATAESLLEALDLWRGPVAAGIPDEIRSHPAFVAVDGEYPSAVKSAADLAVEAGPAAADRVLPVVREAAARHPLDEALQARLMLVLAATGKQAEALEVFQATRQVLADDLGLDPGAELQAAHRRVLKAGTGKQPAASQAPAQLPADLAAFAGRRQELDQFPAIGRQSFSEILNSRRQFRAFVARDHNHTNRSS